MKTKFTEAQLVEISKIQERDNITRKAAVKKYSRLLKINKVPDFKAAAANDSDTRPVVRRKPKKVQPVVTPTVAGNARAEGLRLYKLAGRPKKNDFVHVYGKPGVAWTWEARAKAVGLDSAEKAAAQFQKMLALPKQSCLVDAEPVKKGAVA